MYLTLIHKLEGHTNWVQCVAFSPDGTTALTGSHDGTIRHWDLAQGKSIARFNNHGKVKAPVKDVYFTRDGKNAIVSNWSETRTRKFDDAVLILDLKYGAEIKRFPTGHVVLSTHISPTNRFLLTASANVVTLWDFNSGHAMLKVSDHHNAIVRFHPDETSFFVSSQNNGTNLMCYKVSEKESVVFSYPNLVPHYIGCMAVTPNGKSLMVADDKILVVDLHSNQQIRALNPSDKPVLIRDLAISPDGKLLATVAQEQFISMWDIDRGKELTRVPAHVSSHRQLILCATFSPDGSQLLTGGGDHTACLWHVET